MSGHVDHEILDYLEARLGEQRMEDVRRHLEECDECAADVAWARALREQVLAQGLRHLAPERIVDISDGGSELASEEEQRHLGSCAVCRGELEWARSQAPVGAVHVLEVERPGRTPVRERAGEHPSRRREWRWALGGAGLALAAVVIVVLLPTRELTPPIPTPAPPASAPPTEVSPAIPLAVLARVEPLPVTLTRGVPDAGSFEEARMLGLEAYQDAAYDSAMSHFRVALAMRADAEVSLYLGSAALLRRDAATAVAPLQAAARSDDPAIRSEGLWNLVNALLLVERPDEALAAARELRSRSGPHRSAADSIIANIERGATSR